MNGTTLIQQPGIEPLLEVLHQERRVLERLMYRLSQAKLLVDARQDRFLAPAADDVTAIERQLGEVEMLRSILVAGIAENWHTPEQELTLSEFVRRADPEHALLLEAELDRLRALAAEVEELKQEVVDKSRARLEATQQAIVRLADGPADLYDRDGSPRSSSSPGLRATL